MKVRKLVDQNPDPTVDDLSAGAGLEHDRDRRPDAGQVGRPDRRDRLDGDRPDRADGFVNFQWTTATPVDSIGDGLGGRATGLTYDRSATTCTYRTPDTPTDRPLPDS